MQLFRHVYQIIGYDYYEVRTNCDQPIVTASAPVADTNRVIRRSNDIKQSADNQTVSDETVIASQQTVIGEQSPSQSDELQQTTTPNLPVVALITAAPQKKVGKRENGSINNRAEYN